MTRKNIERERWKMSDLSEYNCPSCGADSNHKSIVIGFKVKIAELEKEKEILRVVCEEADGIACNCTITDSQAVERLLDLFEKNRDFYIPFKPREPTQAAYDELFNDKD
jgi:hypothetical protein